MNASVDCSCSGISDETIKQESPIGIGAEFLLCFDLEAAVLTNSREKSISPKLVGPIKKVVTVEQENVYAVDGRIELAVGVRELRGQQLSF